MKRNAIVSVCCALLFTNILVAANAKDIEGLIGKCSNGDRKACKELETAVPKLTDQALLAKIAVGDTIGGDKGAFIRVVAVYNLTDQALLAKIAIGDEAWTVRAAAVEKLTDLALLAKIAVEDKNPTVRHVAAEKLTDQASLTKTAETPEDPEDPVDRAEAIAELYESNPAMKRLAGNLGALTSDAGESIARIKLAIQEPRIQSRFPRIVFAASVYRVSRSYSYVDPQYGPGGIMRGESVSFVLSQDRKTLAEANWSTYFPQQTTDFTFLAANVYGGDLLADLLHSAVFTQDDLAELSSSEIPEVRRAAVRNLTDQAALAKIAAEDKVPDVRQPAVWRLTDQVLLAKIAVEDEDPAVRQTAEQRLAQIRKHTK